MKRKGAAKMCRVLAVDVLIAAFLLLNFAYFHHVNPLNSQKTEPVETVVTVTEPQTDVEFRYEMTLYEESSRAFLTISAQTSAQIVSSTLFVEYDSAKMSYQSFDMGTGLACDNISVRENGNVLNVSADIDGVASYVFNPDSTPEDHSDNVIAVLWFDLTERDISIQDFKVTVNPARLFRADNEPATYSLSNGERVLTASGDFREKFPDKFTDGEVIETDNSYMSANVNVTYTRQVVSVEAGDAVCHVVDIYVRSFEYFRSALLYDTIEGGGNHVIETQRLASKSNAIAAVNGDYCSARSVGPAVRNGVVHRTTEFEDIFVMYTDGTMKGFNTGTYSDLDYYSGNIWQVWSFGPNLMTSSGEAISKFDYAIAVSNPRTAIGYFEPGHYCFVTVDGRDMGGSVGLTLGELSQFFYDLGCVAAYNLDGGSTSVAVYDGEIINTPYRGRPCSDIVYIPKE